MPTRLLKEFIFSVRVGLDWNLLQIAEAANINVNELPSMNSNDAVDFYYLETSLPFNVPKYIIDAAGASFVEYSTTQAGLGVWDQTTGLKMTIQFVANDYVGSLLPQLIPITEDTGRLFWNNSGSIVVANPIDQNEWINSRHIGSTSGEAYQELVKSLQQNQDLYTIYQPVSVVRPTAEQLQVNSSLFNGDTSQGLGDILLQPENSYNFVNDMLVNLGTYGVDLQTFLQIYGSAFSYVAHNRSVLTLVEWPADGPANYDVYQWFTKLEACYKLKYQDAVAANSGADGFLAEVKGCYGEYAYVYASSNSVYNVTLMNFSSVQSPMLYRYIYNIPPVIVAQFGALSIIDYVVVVGVVIAIVWGLYFYTSKLFTKTQRRRVSFEGERIAEKAVTNLAKREEDIKEDNWNRNTVWGDPSATVSAYDYFYQSSKDSPGSRFSLTRMLSGGGSNKGPKRSLYTSSSNNGTNNLTQGETVLSLSDGGEAGNAQLQQSLTDPNRSNPFLEGPSTTRGAASAEGSQREMSGFVENASV